MQFNSQRRLFLAASAGLASASCSEYKDRSYTQEDQNALAEQQSTEEASSGKNKFARHVYQGYKGLAELPWFELDSSGQLICVDESVPMGIDVHAHLGMSILFKPKLDLLKKHARTIHLLDCDGSSFCDFDLDVYANGNFSDGQLDELSTILMEQGLWGNEVVETQTIPNLLAEMDAMRIEKSVLLPIKFNFWFGDDMTEQWRNAVVEHGTERLHTGFSVSPRSKNAVTELETAYKNGGRICKLHPTVQGFFPDYDKLDEFYSRAQELGVIVFFHGGRAGIEPASKQQYALPRYYQHVFKNFPELKCIIGHGGARDSAAMIEVAKPYTNVYLGIHGQSLTMLDNMINSLGSERLLFGTDWPFYHIGSSLAKVLIVTEHHSDLALRQRILRDNAVELLTLI